MNYNIVSYTTSPPAVVRTSCPNSIELKPSIVAPCTILDSSHRKLCAPFASHYITLKKKRKKPQSEFKENSTRKPNIENHNIFEILIPPRH